MDIYKMYDIVVNNTFETIKKDGAMIMALLRLYSTLYLNNAPTLMCEACHQKYYNKINQNGKIMLSRYKEIQEKENEPIKKGLKFLGAPINKHVFWEQITDSEALDYISKGVLSEDDFKKVPKKKSSKKGTAKKEEIKNDPEKE